MYINIYSELQHYTVVVCWCMMLCCTELFNNIVWCGSAECCALLYQQVVPCGGICEVYCTVK